MKNRIILAIASIFLFTGCSKTDNTHSNTNTIGMTDNGINIVMTSTSPASNENVVNVTLIKTGSSTALVLEGYNTSSSRMVNLYVKAYGSFTGKGTFTQTGSNGFENHLVEYFAGGQSYMIDHSEFNVNNSNDTYMDGTYTLYLTNDYGTKTVTGYFVANNPLIQ
jgi:hypothetical protein